MPAFISRKNFLQIASFGASGVLVSSIVTAQQIQQDKPPALKPDLVKDFVIAGAW
jgi:hypothetical protein